MNDNSLFRAADNLLDKQTLINFIYVLLFLIIYKNIQKYTNPLNVWKWLKTSINFILSAVLVATAIFLLKVCADLSNTLRFGRITSVGNFKTTNGWLAFIFLFGFSLVFSVYLYLSDKITKEIINIKIKAITDGLIVFLLFNALLLVPQILNSGFEGVFSSIAIWIPASFACALAFVIFNYHEYLSTFKNQEKELKIVRCNNK